MSKKEMTDQEFLRICQAAYKGFDGDVRDLERAIGTLYIARNTGWKPLYLMHDRKSLKKYEEHLGIKFQDQFEPEGPDAKRSLAWVLLSKARKTLTNFWSVVRGETAKEIRTPEFRPR